jgi:flagellin
VTAVATASVGTFNANTGTSADNIIFSDARATAGTGAAADLGTITIAFTQNTDASTATTVSNTTVDTDGNATITIDLGTDSDSAASATAALINTALNDTDVAEAVQALTIINIDSVDSALSEIFDSGSGAALTSGTNATLELASSNFGSAEFVGVNVLQGAFATVNTSAAASTRESGADIGVQINGQVAQGKGLQASLTTGGFSAQITFKAANNLATTDGQATITVTGGGSLFQIGQEVSSAGQIGLGIEAINTARLGGVTGKLFELGSGGGKSLTDVGPSVPGADLVKIIDESLNRVTNLRGRLGALQKNVIDTNISTLTLALENITEARSQIIDTDFASETANLTRAQILSQSALSVLAIANQNPSQVLSLLG